MTGRSKDDQLADMYKANEKLMDVVFRMCEANQRLIDRLFAAQEEIQMLRVGKLLKLEEAVALKDTDERWRISPKYYRERTGREPTARQLAQVNCPKAGQEDHENCGWCLMENLPFSDVLTPNDGNSSCPDWKND